METGLKLMPTIGSDSVDAERKLFNHEIHSNNNIFIQNTKLGQMGIRPISVLLCKHASRKRSGFCLFPALRAVVQGDAEQVHNQKELDHSIKGTAGELVW